MLRILHWVRFEYLIWMDLIYVGDGISPLSFKKSMDEERY